MKTTYTSPALRELGSIAGTTARFGTDPAMDFGPRVRGSQDTGSISTIDCTAQPNNPQCQGFEG